ncbi:MAG TPA: hypothetical protein VIV57_17005 [Anaeromyxobacter sp.]
MSAGGERRRRRAGALLALPAAAFSLLAPPATARGDALNLRLEGNYGNADTTSTDAAGNSSTTHAWNLSDAVRASLSKSLYETLVLSGTGLLEDVHARSEGATGTSTSTARSWAAGGRLDFGGQLLRGGVSYDRRQTSADSSTSLFGGGSLSSSSPTLVNDALSGTLTWQPIGLLPLSLRFSRSTEHDTDRTRRDSETTSVALDTTFSPSDRVDGSGAVGWAEAEDRLNGSSTATWSARGSVRYGGSMGRATLYLSDGAAASVSNTRASGPGGVVVTRQLASAGLALVEALPATPTQSTLRPLPALVDGNTTDAAGVNLGTSTAARGDVARRHLGLQFPDAITPVNTLWVWVDRPLPPALAAQFVWTAFQSEDNVTWQPVPITAPVAFGTFEARFEISLPTTRARYLKVVTAPLSPSATTDPRFADIQVTELQAFQIVAATSVLGWSRSWSNTVNGGLSLPLTANRELSYDLSLTLGLRGPPVRNGWFLTNGLSWGRQLSPKLGLSARLQRSDNGGTGTKSTGQTTWGASLAAQPLRTLTASAGYSGAAVEQPEGTVFTHGLTGSVAAALYDGWSASASGGSGVSFAPHRTSRNSQVSFSTTVTPATNLSLSGTYSFSEGTSSGAGVTASGATAGPSSTSSEAITGSASWTPVPALALSGSATRLRDGSQPPHSLAAFQIAYSPFRGGSLVVGLGHAETFDYQSSATTRSSTASLTWRLTSWANLLAGYVLAESKAPLGSTTTHALNARLTLTL